MAGTIFASFGTTLSAHNIGNDQLGIVMFFVTFALFALFCTAFILLSRTHFAGCTDSPHNQPLQWTGPERGSMSGQSGNSARPGR